MKKTIILITLMSLLLISLVFSLEMVFVSKDKDSYIIIDFTPQRRNIFDFFDIGAIIPSYVNAGEIISFKGELLRNAPISDLLGTPNELEITIAMFDSAKPNFMGQTVNTFKVPIPSNIQEMIRIETNVIFDAQMKTPSVQGKYRYRAIAKRNGVPITQINIDYDTFTVAQGVPTVCPSADVETTYLTISNGKIKVVAQTQYIGSDCSPNILKTYNTICDSGYIESGSGENAQCVKQEEPPIEKLCADSDNGKDETKQGNVITDSSQGCENGCLDYCSVYANRVVEFWCESATQKGEAIFIDCPEGTGCKDGACISGEPPVIPPPPTEECTREIGQICDIQQTRTFGGLGDDSGLNDQCKSGWCIDTGKIGGGICGRVGTFSDGKIKGGYKPHPTCELSSEEYKTDICGWTTWAPIFGGFSQCTSGYIILIGGIIALLIIINLVPKK